MICSFCPNTLSRYFRPENRANPQPPEEAAALSFEPRGEKEVNLKCEEWVKLMHPRVLSLWQNDTRHMKRILLFLAQHISAEDDPITPAYTERCVQWHGPLSAEGGYPVLPVFNGEKETMTYVTRALSFFFSSDESYRILRMSDIRGALRNSCNNRLCINTTHILVGKGS